MANVSRLFSVSKLLRAQLQKTPTELNLFKSVPLRAISTSNKKRDIIVESPLPTPPLKLLKEKRPERKDWQSYGFDYDDEVEDLNLFHSTCFLTISLAVVGVSFYYMYYPDYLEIDWTQREAYLLLRQREAAGLPLVDPNYVDPASIELPSEEELEGVEIII